MEMDNQSNNISCTTASRSSSPSSPPLGVKKPRFNSTRGKNMRGTANTTNTIKPVLLANLLAREFSLEPVQKQMAQKMAMCSLSPLFVVNNDDPMTPLATPLVDGYLPSEDPHVGCAPSKRTRLSSRDATGIYIGIGSPQMMDEPIWKAVAAGDFAYSIRSGRTRAVVRYVGMNGTINGNFDHLALSKDADDDNSSN